MKTSVSYDAKVNFAALKTYTWIPYPREQRADVRLNYDFLDQTIRSGVNDGLRQKGLEQLSTGQPDFRVRWYVAIDEEASDSRVSAYFGYADSAGWGYDPNGQWTYDAPLDQNYQLTYTLGSLVLDFVNAKSDKLIWRGAAQNVVNPGASVDQRRQMINAAIQKILQKFPPVVKGK